MDTSKLFSFLFLWYMFVPFVLDLANAQRLKVGFYAKTCPQAEIIVKKHLHTCCPFAENALPRLFRSAKSALEKARPGVVSCADILALVASDVIATIKGPSWEVESGRRDGRISNITEALLNLVPPNANISTLKKEFQQRGLSGDTDPTLDPNYIIRLKGKCKPGDLNTIVEMDPGSFKTFDEDYHTLVAKRRGLFQSDAALLDDTEAKAYVKLQATTHGSTFFEDALYLGLGVFCMWCCSLLTLNHNQQKYSKERGTPG
ncbi:peroxidase 56 [Quercus suber]|uniref:peroxidase n=1 Tax=Quercus suber TaxID=58331 RepID=A0AAW0KTN9_QUESU